MKSDVIFCCCFFSSSLNDPSEGLDQGPRKELGRLGMKANSKVGLLLVAL